MSYYDKKLVEMNADSISFCYTLSGELGDVAKGRDSIRAFLLTFKDYHVISNKSMSETVSIDLDTAFQTGTYHQITILPAGDTVRLLGRFKTHWSWSHNDGWKIKRMETFPIEK